MVRCPFCNHVWSWRLADGRQRCRKCRRRYRNQSVWDHSRLSGRTKHRLAELFALGVPGYRLRFRGIASATAIERFFRQIRVCCAIEEHLRKPFKGKIECDETAFGEVRHGKRGWGAAGKIIVFGLLQRNGTIQAFPLEGRRKKLVMGLIKEHTTPGGLYYTDDWQAYASLSVRGGHIVVQKERGKPKGRDHINGIEGFWSYAKNWLYPYRGVPEKFFHVYLAEVCWRFNHRDQDQYPLIIKMLKKTPTAVSDAVLVQSE